mgnify:CR=1 FL=1
MNILFMGTPDFAQESLKCLYEEKYNIIGVVTNQDKPKGRGMKMLYTPVKEYALEKNIPIYQPEKVRNNTEFIQEIKNLNPDLICVVAYGKILPKELTIDEVDKLLNIDCKTPFDYRNKAMLELLFASGMRVSELINLTISDIDLENKVIESLRY